MMALLGNQKGNIALALSIAIVAVMSGITMATLAYKDTIDARYDFDSIQELHLLKSELNRGQRLVETLDYSGEGFILPDKFVSIEGSHSKTMYKNRTKVARGNLSTGGGLYFSDGYSIRTLIKADRGTGSHTLFGRNLSMVSKYGEKGIRRNSFAGYHYFTDNESSTNNTNVYFYGYDTIYGKVHSNTDIHIKQYSGWPTFYGTVYTSGVIVPHNGTPDYSQVFRDGYFEHVGHLEFNATADQIRAYGQRVNGEGYDPNKISFVTINGSGFTSKVGEILYHNESDTADVWTQYPPRAGQYQFRNRFTMRDTIWSDGMSGSVNDGSAIVFHKVWIRGTVTGKQTWCAVDTMYINNDLLYSGTPRGSAPDAEGNLNRQDFAGYVSEKSIIIQYGYRDPEDSLRYRPNCDGQAEGVWIYGALCALGDGMGNSHQDGVFSFEYQHPHPSTPAVRLNNNDYVWDRIDLHRYRYPNSTWPAQIDYPWYNPLWPERFPYMERGNIHLYGSVAQRRRGFVHRSTNDLEYPNPNGIWNIPIDMCGGPSGMAVTDPVLGFVGSGVNAPNTVGSGVGYNKDYHFDNRFSFTQPPHFPEVHIQGGLTPFESESWALLKPPDNF
jgi:hypothetical protein